MMRHSTYDKREVVLRLITCLCAFVGFAESGVCYAQRLESAFFPIRDLESRRWGVIDRKGRVLVEPKFKDVSRVTFSTRTVKRVGQESVLLYGKEKWLYVTRNGIKAIEPAVKPNNDSYLVDNLGESLFGVVVDADLKKSPITSCVVLDPFGDWKPKKELGVYGGGFSEGLIAIYCDGKFGYADRSGRIVIEPQFDDVHCYPLSDGRFNDGAATVKVGDKWGYISRSGKWILKPQFSAVTPFDGKFAIVFPEDLKAAPQLIDRDGKFIRQWPTMKDAPRFLCGTVLSEGLSLVWNPDTELYGFMDRETNWLLPQIHRRAAFP